MKTKFNVNDKVYTFHNLKVYRFKIKSFIIEGTDKNYTVKYLGDLIKEEVYGQIAETLVAQENVLINEESIFKTLKLLKATVYKNIKNDINEIELYDQLQNTQINRL